MADYPSRCVIDINTLIDLYIGNLLPTVFSLGWEILAPDVIIAELKSEPSSSALLACGLREMSFSEFQVREIEALRRRYRRSSVNDLFALLLARSEGVLLLTGDGHLHQAAEQEGISVHDTIWLIDLNVDRGAISASIAARALQAMLDNGRRLPREECSERIRRWQGGDTYAYSQP